MTWGQPGPNSQGQSGNGHSSEKVRVWMWAPQAFGRRTGREGPDRCRTGQQALCRAAQGKDRTRGCAGPYRHDQAGETPDQAGQRVSGADNLRSRHRAGRSTALVRDAERVPAQARDSRRRDNRTAPGRARASSSCGGSLIADVCGQSHGKLSNGAPVGFAVEDPVEFIWCGSGISMGKTPPPQLMLNSAILVLGASVAPVKRYNAGARNPNFAKINRKTVAGMYRSVALRCV